MRTHAGKLIAVLLTVCCFEGYVMSNGFRLKLFDLVTYEREVLPARNSYIEEADPRILATQLRRVVGLAQVGALPETLRPHAGLFIEECEGLIAVIRGTKPIPDQFKADSERQARERFCEAWVMPILERHLCDGINGQEYGSIEISGWLGEYLIDKSDWIAEMVDSDELEGGKLDLGQTVDYFSKEQLQAFESELRNLPRPDKPKLAEQYDRLLDYVRRALSSDRLVLLRIWS
jgi:hypothetical protein